MLKQLRHRSPFFFSILLHVIVLSMLIISFEWTGQNYVLENANQNDKVLNAIMVNDIKMEMPHAAPLPPPPPPKSKEIIKKASKAPQATPLPAQPKTIALPVQKKQISKELIQKQLLADLKKQTQKQQKIKHAELEKAFAKELQAQAEKSLQQQLLAEKNRAASAQAAKMQGIVDKYKALILQAIAQYWLVPSGADKSLSCQLLIRIAPGGTVLDVQIVKTSGDDALDRSARSAVLKASPLPVPTKSDELEPFRQFILKVKPENVLTRDNGLS